MKASEELYRTRAHEGFVVVEALVENSTGGAPTVHDVQAWTKAYGVTFPVVADPGKIVFRKYVPHTVLPTYLLVGRDGVITYRAEGTTDDATAEAKLRKALDAALSASPAKADAGGGG